MKCLICKKIFKKNNHLKTHINFHHNENNNRLECEYIFIKSILNITNQEIENVKNEYLGGSTPKELKDKYNFNFNNLILLSGIKRTHSESKKTNAYKEKYAKAIKERYGVSNISQSELIKIKKKQSFIKHYGYENNFCNKDISKKAQDNINHFQAWENNKKMLMQKYGVENMSQIPTAKLAISRSAKYRSSLLSYENKLKNTENARKSVHYTSQLELRIQNILNLFNIEYKANLFLYGYNFDFMFHGKIILEIQGDYWHANPKLYKKDDLIIGEKTAEYFWNKDKKKKDILEKNGYKILYLWESEINNMTDEDIIDYLTRNLIL